MSKPESISSSISGVFGLQISGFDYSNVSSSASCSIDYPKGVDRPPLLNEFLEFFLEALFLPTSSSEPSEFVITVGFRTKFLSIDSYAAIFL